MRSNKLFLLISLLTCAVGIFFGGLQSDKMPPAAAKTSAADTTFNRAESDANLQTQADELLLLFDSMPSVPVYLKDEPILTSGTNTERSLAYTTCDNSQFPSIIFKRDFYQKANRKKITNILKHELTHAWLCRQNLMSVGHGAAFHEKFKSIGGWGD